MKSREPAETLVTYYHRSLTVLIRASGNQPRNFKSHEKTLNDLRWRSTFPVDVSLTSYRRHWRLIIHIGYRFERAETEEWHRLFQFGGLYVCMCESLCVYVCTHARVFLCVSNCMCAFNACLCDYWMHELIIYIFFFLLFSLPSACWRWGSYKIPPDIYIYIYIYINCITKTRGTVIAYI